MLDAVGNATVTPIDSEATLDRRTVTIDDHDGPLARRTTSMLDEVGNVTAVTNARNFTTEFKYDVLNRQTVTIDAAGNRTTSILDAANNAVAMVNARDFRTTYLFDAVNRQSVMIDANNERVTTLYDLGANVVEMRDQLNNATLYQYDALGRQLVMIDALGFRTQRLFDAVGNMTQVTDAQSWSGKGDAALFCQAREHLWPEHLWAAEQERIESQPMWRELACASNRPNASCLTESWTARYAKRRSQKPHVGARWNNLRRSCGPGASGEVDEPLMYQRARHYDPSVGRWISNDPLGYDACEEHLYPYVTGDPDPK